MVYTKLAHSILTSTVWMESDQTRIVWLTLLAMADKHGEVQASIPGLANVARVTVAACEEAITKFMSVDPYSRTKTDGGRRLIEIEGGWFVINHEKYRELASDNDRKRKEAERQKRYRERQKTLSRVTHAGQEPTCNAAVTPSNAEVTTQTKSDQKEDVCHGINGTRNVTGVMGRDKSRQNSHTDTDTDPDPDPDPKERVYESESWRKYLDPSQELAAHTPLLTPWRIRDENQKLKNHKGFFKFLTEQYEKPGMAAGFLRNAQKDPGKNETALELWEHYLKGNSTEAAKIEGVDPLDVFPLKDEWLDYIEANGRMQFELNYPGGTKRERMQFTDILIENEKRAKQEQK